MVEEQEMTLKGFLKMKGQLLLNIGVLFLGAVMARTAQVCLFSLCQVRLDVTFIERFLCAGNLRLDFLALLA